MNLTEEKLIAYADGEISSEEMRAIEATLKARPDLQAFVEQQRALRQHFETGFASLAGEEIPDRLFDVLKRTPVSQRWRWQQRLSSWTSRRFLLWSAMPTAAALACGLVIGVVFTPQGSFRIDHGAMLAQGTLSTALDTQLASAQQASDNVRVGISFKDKSGRYCRTFSDASLAGVACRDVKGWAVAALASAPSENGVYHMASAMPDAIRDTVEKMIAGEPLDATEEMRAREKNWRTR
jgi:negative regulator of sigma E activity